MCEDLQNAGGIGLSIHDIRATGSYIKGTNGTSNGIVPMLRVFNDTARYVDQGGGKRKGSFAIYIEPWHADIHDFLDLQKNHGKEEQRARDLFYALWIPDLFMKRVEENGEWTLMCPTNAQAWLTTTAPRSKSSTKYEAEGKGRKTIKAQDLWFKILESQIETGTPYMLYRRRKRQVQPAEPRHHPFFQPLHGDRRVHRARRSSGVQPRLPRFAEVRQRRSVRPREAVPSHLQVTKNLNRIIDRNYYPIPEARNSNMRHRPIGLGVQGLADVFILMRHPFDSDEARALNREIFETIYYAACGVQGPREEEGAYDTFKGSPASEGRLQFDLWGVTPTDRWEWDVLKDEIKEHGMRNSLLLAPMPTASTAQILGNNEVLRPYTSNIYTAALSGEFIIVNKHLLRDLTKLGLWDDDMKNRIISANGSIQNINEIPDNLKALYRTWQSSSTCPD